MSQLSYEQATAIARQVGFTGDAVPVVVAIGAAESGLRTDKRCLDCVPGVHEDSRGWLQVNVAVDAHPDMAGRNLLDPVECAHAAYEISGGRNFRAWSTFTNGRYLTYLGLAQQIARKGTAAGDPGITMGDITGAAGDTAKTITDAAAIGAGFGALGSALAPLKSIEGIAELVTKAGAWVADPHNWARILEVVVGVAGVFVGAFMVSRDLRDAATKLSEGAALAAAA